MPLRTLTLQQLRRDLAIHDLTDPEDGPHAIQLIVDEAVEALIGVAMRSSSNPRQPGGLGGRQL